MARVAGGALPLQFLSAARLVTANSARLGIFLTCALRRFLDLFDGDRPHRIRGLCLTFAHAPIPLVATYSYVNPLVAMLLGYFLGREIMTPRILFAALLIVGSVALVSGPKKT